MLNVDNIFRFSANSPLIFSQYLFLLFFTMMYGIYCLIHTHNRLRNIYLLAFSLFFYYKCSGFYFLILLLSIVLDYFYGFLIDRNEGIRRKFFLFLSILSNLGLLFYFKYSYFIVDIINELIGIHFQPVNFIAIWSNSLFQSGFDITEIILPVGISFYTFQTLSYSIDIYRRNVEPCKDFFDFAFFVSFFPQLVAGPIVRAIDFIPQIRKPFLLSKREFSLAVLLIIGGLVKKVVISDYISINFVDRVFESPELYTGFMNLMAVYGYTIQIYCDFSGYSDMAIGLAALLGFKLPINFNSPYKATSITDFWRKWHISLSLWLKDYLYIPLGGNRKGKLRSVINILITMILGGLWHGAALKFIIWGLIHGIGLTIHKIWGSALNIGKNISWTIISWAITFHFVAFSWMYFRASSIEIVNIMIQKVVYTFNFWGISDRITGYWKPFLCIGLGFLLHFIPDRFKENIRIYYSRIPVFIQVIVFSLIIFIIFQVRSTTIQPFIYFQF